MRQNKIKSRAQYFYCEKSNIGNTSIVKKATVGKVYSGTTVTFFLYYKKEKATNLDNLYKYDNFQKINL